MIPEFKEGQRSADGSINITDCHHHIFDPRYPTRRPIKDALLEDYRKMQARLGIRRNVIIQGSIHGTDNRCVLDMLAQFGTCARAIVDAHENVTKTDLKKLDDQGVRGIRFNLRRGDAEAAQRLEPMSRRIHEFGWHVQLNINPDQTMAVKAILDRLPTPIVFDHMAHLTGPGLKHPARGIVEELLQKGRAWVKLSGFYLGSNVGPPTYADAGEIASFFVKTAPEFLVWGTDWPHPTAPVEQDDLHLLELFKAWTPDEAIKIKILEENPARLYGF